MNASARNAYMGGMVSTASPARLLVMLFERLGVDVDKAIVCQEASDFAAASPHLLHAQEIVLELAGSLRQDGWSGAAGLASLYSFLHSELVRANVAGEAERTAAVRALVEPLADAWRAAALEVSAASASVDQVG